MAVWLAERRAKFPTKARVQEKQEAEAAKRAEAGKAPKPAPKNEDEERAEALRRELAEVERKLEKRKRETNDEGDEMRAPKEDSEGSSDDEPPETQTTKKTPSSYLPPPPISRADPTAHCKYYSTGGICGKKGKCRFVHDPEMRERALQEQAANGGRITLKQRLLRNEKEIEDLAIIQSIVNLRGNGKMPAVTKPAAKAPGSSTRRHRSTSLAIKQECHTERLNSSGQTVVPPPDSDPAPVRVSESGPQVKLSQLQNLYISLPWSYSGATLLQALSRSTVANSSLGADLDRRYTKTLINFIKRHR